MPQDSRAKPWDKFVSKEEQERYARSGFYKTPPIGKAALLIVDMQYRMLGTQPMPMDEAIKEFPTSCGEVGWAAVPRIRRLRDYFRERQWLVAHFTLGQRRAFVQQTTEVAAPAAHMGLVESDDTPDDLGFRILDTLKPQAGEPAICKYGPSAFFGTPTASLLIREGVNTVCVVGSTTSGCIRATVVDAFSYGFSVLVPADCVFDRSELSHGVSLFDMATRYAQVTDLDETLELLQAASQGVNA